MSLSSLFILSNRGDTIINRDFRYELKKGINEIFFQKVHLYNEGDDNIAPPIFNLDGINYIYIQRYELFFVIVTIDNVSANYYLEILERLIIIIKDHCGIISEEAISKNFTLVYEIIDEMIDFGVPQLNATEEIRNFVFTNPESMIKTNNNIIQDLIPTKVKSSDYSKKPINPHDNKSNNNQNDIFVDIIEKVVVLFNRAGNVINSGIFGCIKMKSYLHNHPMLEVVLCDEISIGNNTKGLINLVSNIDDYNFHHSVCSKNFESKKILTLSPPEGEFILMNYKINSDFTPPFKFVTIVEESSFKLMLRIKLIANYTDKVFAVNVVIKIVLPKKTQSVYFKFNKNDKRCQNAEFVSKDCVGLWTIKQVFGGDEFILDTKITLATDTPKESRKELGPILLSFDMPNYNVSKFQIKELNIISNDKKYSANKWIKVITQTNSYTARIA